MGNNGLFRKGINSVNFLLILIRFANFNLIPARVLENQDTLGVGQFAPPPPSKFHV